MVHSARKALRAESGTGDLAGLHAALDERRRCHRWSVAEIPVVLKWPWFLTCPWWFSKRIELIRHPCSSVNQRTICNPSENFQSTGWNKSYMSHRTYLCGSRFLMDSLSARYRISLRFFQRRFKDFTIRVPGSPLRPESRWWSVPPHRQGFSDVRIERVIRIDFALRRVFVSWSRGYKI